MSLTRRNFVRLLAGGAAASTTTPLAGQTREPPPLPPPSDDESFWLELRKEFLIPQDEVYCNSATLGAMPRRVLEVVVRNMTEIEATLAHWDYRPQNPDWFAGYRPFDEVRGPLAALVGCSTEELALTQNATFGMNFIAHGIDLRPGDEVLQTDQEHPGGKCGWELRAKRHGAVWKSVAIPMPPNDPEQIIRRFREAITPKTRVLAIPHQTSMLGLVLPVKDLIALGRAQGHPNIFIVIDGAQSVGHLGVNIGELGCDAYFFSPHKWLLAPPGCGALYIRKSRQNEIWTTLASSEWANDEAGAYRFMQYGTGNRALLDGLKAAVEFRTWLGQERVARRIHTLGTRLREGLRKIPGVRILSSVHPELAAGITTYAIEGMKGPAIMDAFWKRKYRVRSMGDENGVRHSLHIYNVMKDVETALEIVRDLAARQG
jgi:selenocysteine lyase/cysteine desulfurase